jgi:hypothetical protein
VGRQALRCIGGFEKTIAKNSQLGEKLGLSIRRRERHAATPGGKPAKRQSRATLNTV